MDCWVIVVKGSKISSQFPTVSGGKILVKAEKKHAGKKKELQSLSEYFAYTITYML